MPNKYGFFSIFYNVLVDEENLIMLMKPNIDFKNDFKRKLLQRVEEYKKYSRDYEEYVRQAIKKIVDRYKVKYIKSRGDKIYILRDKVDVNGVSIDLSIKIAFQGYTEEKTSPQLLRYMEDFSFLVSLNAFFEVKDDEEALDIVDKIVTYFFSVTRTLTTAVKGKINILKSLYGDNDRDIIKHSIFCLVRITESTERQFVVSFDYETTVFLTLSNEPIEARIRVYKVSKSFYRGGSDPVRRVINDYVENLFIFFVILKYWSIVRNTIRNRLIIDLNSVVLDFRHKYARIAPKMLGLEKGIKDLRLLQMRLGEKLLEYSDIIFLIKVLTSLSLSPKLNNIRNLVNREVYDPSVLDFAQEAINSWNHLIDEIGLLVNQLSKLYNTVTDEVKSLVEEYNRSLTKKRLLLTIISISIPSGIALLLNALSLIREGHSLLGISLIALSIFIIVAIVVIWFGGIWQEKAYYREF